MQKYLVIWKWYEYMKPWSEIDYDQVSLQGMKNTWQFIKEYDFRFLAHPKAKHDFVTEQFILWEKDTTISSLKNNELSNIIEWFSMLNYLCWRNPSSLQTIPWIIHYHIAKFKNIDDKISTLL